MDKEELNDQAVINSHPENKPDVGLEQSNDRAKIISVLVVSIFWIILAYFSSLIIWSVLTNLRPGMVLDFSLIRLGFFDVYFRDFKGESKPFVFIFDLLFLFPLVGLSVFSFLHQRLSKTLFFVITVLFLLLSALTLLTFLQECTGLSCMGQGIMGSFETIGIFVAASLLPILWFSKKGFVSPKEIFIKGLPVFIVVILLGVLSMSPFLAERISLIIKNSKEISKVKTETTLLEPNYLPSIVGKRVLETSNYGTEIWWQYRCNEIVAFHIRQAPVPKNFNIISMSQGKLSTAVSINGNMGYYIESGPSSDISSQQLIWESAESVIIIQTLSACILPKEELVRIAESMKP